MFTTTLSKALYWSNEADAIRLDGESQARVVIENIFYPDAGSTEIMVCFSEDEVVMFAEQEVSVDEAGKFIAQSVDDGAYQITARMHRPFSLSDVYGKVSVSEAMLGNKI